MPPPTLSDLPELISPRQFREVAGVSEPTQAAMRHGGRLPFPYLKIGSLVRYKKNDVLTFIESAVQAPKNGGTKNGSH